MLAAVAPDSRYENLRDYIITNGGGGRPTAVRGFDQSARQPVQLPTGTLPGVKTPIPTSSARPGKATNQRIPYARLCFNFPTTGNPLMKQEVQEGDITFVHRPNNVNGTFSLPGHGPNRSSTIGNIAQLNAMLANHAAQNRGDLTMDPADSPFGVPRAATWSERWAQCTALGRWTPDGVVISSEHEHGTPIPLVGGMASNPGDLWNICVQGPTHMKNNYVSPTSLALSYTEQNIDSGMRVLDKVFVGLFAQENRDAAGTNQFYSFYWKPFTSRQLLAVDLAADAAARVAPAPGSLNTTSGPTAGDFTRIVSAWRVGSIMDAHLSEGRVQINVIIEEWPLEWLRNQFNPLVGASVALRMPSTAPPVGTAIQVLAAVAPNLNNAAPGRNFVVLYQNLYTRFNVSQADGSSTDPYGFGASMQDLEAEFAEREKWDALAAAWQAASPTQRKRQRLKNPGDLPTPPSVAMRRFYDKMEASGPVAALTRVFLERDRSGVLGDTQLNSDAALIGIAATYAEDTLLYRSLTDDERELVEKARIASALIAKLRAPLQLFERITLKGLAGWFTLAEDEAEEAGAPPGGILDPGPLAADDF